MKMLPRLLCVICAIMLLVGVANAQLKCSTNGQAFSCAAISLTYSVPQGFDSTPENQLPHDATGREQILLALWAQGHRTPVPQIVFIYDHLARSSSLSPQTIAEDYLKALKPGEGYKMGVPQRVELANVPTWRMDYWRPDDAGQSYNSAIVIPSAEHKILFIQMNAASSAELNALVDSLRSLKFGSKASSK